MKMKAKIEIIFEFVFECDMTPLQINLTCEILNLSIKKVLRDSNKQIIEKNKKKIANNERSGN